MRRDYHHSYYNVPRVFDAVHLAMVAHYGFLTLVTNFSNPFVAGRVSWSVCVCQCLPYPCSARTAQALVVADSTWSTMRTSISTQEALWLDHFFSGNRRFFNATVRGQIWIYCRKTDERDRFYIRRIWISEFLELDRQKLSNKNHFSVSNRNLFLTINAVRYAFLYYYLMTIFRNLGCADESESSGTW